MKAYWIFVILTALTIIGCAKENSSDSNYRFEFDFDLIKGSYSSSLERFKLWTPEVDCD